MYILTCCENLRNVWNWLQEQKKNSKKLLDEEDMVVERFYGPTRLKAQLRWKKSVGNVLLPTDLALLYHRIF
jgi:hypothetical protein